VILIFSFFPQIIVIVIVIKLKKPNYYKLLLLNNVYKMYNTFCHGEPEKKIWYTVLFQKKYVEKGTTTPKKRKENLYFMLMYPRSPKTFCLFIICQEMCSLILTIEISFLYLQPGTLHFSFLSEFFCNRRRIWRTRWKLGF